MSSNSSCSRGTADPENAIEAINGVGLLRFYTKLCPPARLTEGIQAVLAERERRVEGKADTEERSQSRHGVGEEALNRISVGVIVIDAVVNVIFKNPLGAELVYQQDGLLVDPYVLWCAWRCRFGFWGKD